MIDPNHPPEANKNWFNQHAPAPFASNRRLGVRYIRTDIEVTLWKASTLNLAFKPMRKELSVKLIDISSRGVLIETNTKLNINKKVLLTLSFVDDWRFKLLSTVVRKIPSSPPRYGIKFDKVSDKLADYLLQTQKILTFK